MHELLVSVPIWTFLVALTGLATTIVGAVWAAGKWLSRQFQESLDVRFEAIEASRTEAQKLWGMRFDPLERHAIEEPKRWDAIQQEVAQVRQDLMGRDLRMVRIESEVQHLPQRGEFARLHERIDDLAEAVHMAGGKLEELTAIRSMMVRINDYLLENKP